MFCYQCEQRAQDSGCTTAGICGKDPLASNIQDLIVHGCKALSVYAAKAGELGIRDEEIDLHVVKALFSTVTNVDFEPGRLTEIAKKTFVLKERMRSLFLAAYKKANKADFDEASLPGVALWKMGDDADSIVEQASSVGIADRDEGDDTKSLKELVTYGLKGMAAYADHAARLGYADDGIFAFFHKALSYVAANEPDTGGLADLAMECGRMNVKCMEMLDKAHTETFGHPVPTKVRTGAVAGPAILVSGHDMLDLYELLKRTEGTGVNVYTHGEMLPAHGYPALKAFGHLAGNYGGAWQDQQKEFESFPGPILMTTNCIQKPRESYRERIYTTGLVGYPGVAHLEGPGDFGRLVNAALALRGFEEASADKEILVGFGHDSLLKAADKIVDLVKRGKLRRFFVIGGCDGARPGRSYYTDFARKVPADCVILTLACGKYRFNKLEFGDIEGIPRLVDVGQCNDAYSAVVVASALSEAFGVGLSELPLSFVLSWYEQKAVAILLSLLSLGIKGMRIGPSLPAFLSPGVLGLLAEKFRIAAVTDPESDLAEELARDPSPDGVAAGAR